MNLRTALYHVQAVTRLLLQVRTSVESDPQSPLEVKGGHHVPELCDLRTVARQLSPVADGYRAARTGGLFVLYRLRTVCLGGLEDLRTPTPEEPSGLEPWRSDCDTVE